MEPVRGIEVTQMSADAAAVGVQPAALAPDIVDGAARKRFRARASWAVTCLGVDVATLAAAAIGSMVAARGDGFNANFSGWTIAFALVALVLFQTRGLYVLRIKISMLDDLRRIASALTIAVMAVISVRLLLTGAAAPALSTARPWAFALVYVGAGRVALYWSQHKARVAGESVRPTLIVGSGRVGRTLGKRLLERPELGLKPLGYLDADPQIDEAVDGLDVLGAPEDLERLVSVFGIEHVIVTFSHARDEELLALVDRAEALGLGVSVVPRLYEKVPERLTVEHLGGLPLVTAHPADPRGFHIAIKYALDRIVAGTILLLVSPVLIVAALAVLVSMGRPIFFRQVRIGRDGREFAILKFRSMKQASPEEIAAAAAAIAEGSAPGGVEGVDRRTRVGAILRKTSLDELPQLLNVLKGDMSLVGPRPERPEFVTRFEQDVYRYGDRHRVKSGITGWAQVHGLRGKTSIADRAEWDNWYIENFSLWLDVKILAMTAAAVVGAYREVE